MKLFNGIVFCLLLSSSFVSCSQEDEKYSCNEDIDAWVKSHVDEIKTMKREDWLKVDKSYSIAVYRAFSPEQKFEFWQNKLVETERLDWNPEELAHIKKARDFVTSNIDIFKKGSLSIEMQDRIDSFVYQWQKEAKEKLKWDDKVGIAILASGMKLKNKKGDLVNGVSVLKTSTLSSKNESYCNCNKTYDFCGIGWSCEDTSCLTQSGCGWFLASDCNGECK